MKFLDVPTLRRHAAKELDRLFEVQQRSKFRERLFVADFHSRKTPTTTTTTSSPAVHSPQRHHQDHQFLQTVDAGLLTFLLHCEARIASALGYGFYTIGPCGEELLGSIAHHLRPTDAVALHYRHLATSITRQLIAGRTIPDIALAKARGFTCSSLDPVTGGKHCAIGGQNDYDFIVTSTLASQAPPAVGRALAIPLCQILLSSNSNKEMKAYQKFPADAVSYVSVGDGSVNNAHFLSSLNLAKYAQHRSIKCPVVFGISDNNKCISLPGFGWIQQFVKSCGITSFVADGCNVDEVYHTSSQAMDYTRTLGRPSILLLERLPRRFGHAASDRQLAYMTEQEIQHEMNRDPLADMCLQAIATGTLTKEYLLDRFDFIQSTVEQAFDVAVNEPKVTNRQTLIDSNSAPIATISRVGRERGSTLSLSLLLLSSSSSSSSSLAAASSSSSITDSLPFTVRFNPNHLPNNIPVPAIATTGTNPSPSPSAGASASPSPALLPMRKHMTLIYDELLCRNPRMVYVGEDVEHGGYYLVTEGLATKHSSYRVRDYPPDETTLLGSAMGLAQAGLLPVVEIPYAKYLDCAADMFFEAVNTYWLSNGTQSVGMLIRLQGFDKGIFGGNYHTHNSLHLPPGLDVVCYSNGQDYVRGIRFCHRQIQAGRVVMTVDSTELLNKRHLYEERKDQALLSMYPTRRKEQSEEEGGEGGSEGESDEMTFDDIVIYDRRQINNNPSFLSVSRPEGNIDGISKDKGGNNNGQRQHSMTISLVIVTYGNGVATSLLAVDRFYAAHPDTKEYILVVDSPCLSQVPNQLTSLFNTYKPSRVIFADVCKLTAGAPLQYYISQLQQQRLLPTVWRIVGATRTYNPLGNTLTFLSSEDVYDMIQEVISTR